MAEKHVPRMVVGLTGGIGSGKSAATHIFSSLGVNIVDSDVVAREVVETGSPALQAIAEHFGPDVLQDDGQLNRAVLRNRIFSNADEKLWLEKLLHPLIRLETEKQLRSAQSDYVILSSPLLLETGQDVLTDRVLVIDAPELLQIERARLRDNTSTNAIEAIMASQWSRERRLRCADDIIVNDSDIANLEREIRKLHDHYCKDISK
ncbi:MAG: dephospho-CoA kinase [Gammaproteobacteria bacterium]|nr:dephospho-CoA kinase [Gammaproteobacteria bacterium]MDP2140166.1 dephospho-CoA kinase [Gammaproteobacteria bacterium]MDP2348042.1 dephospho-CoA kinase [Gammaproteobacteria bacterium]